MRNRPVRVGLLGLGVVGSGVAEILTSHRRHIADRTGVDLELVRALVRSPKKARRGAAGKVALTSRPAEIIDAPDVDIVVELMGGIEPARQLILGALASGKRLVTANKAVLAAHGPEIFAAARAAESDIYFEAAVAGGVPIIRTLREALASDRVAAVQGILNGTTNFIIGRLQAGETYGDALAEAQRLGEADPTLDVSGRDAADKLAILILLAFGRAVRPERIATEGITRLTPEVLADAAELGFAVKLLASARLVSATGDEASSRGRRGHRGERIDARVHPAFLPLDHPLAAVPAAKNAILVASDALGPTLYQGAGAGALPTGSAVVSDIIEASRDLRAGIFGRVLTAGSRGAAPLLDPGASRDAFYVRCEVRDEPGVLAAMTATLARHRISLASVLQRQRASKRGGSVPVILVTHRTERRAMVRALAGLSRLSALRAPPNVVRIETDPRAGADS